MLCIGYSDLSSCSLSVLDYNQKSNQKRRNIDNYQCLFRAFFEGEIHPHKKLTPSKRLPHCVLEIFFVGQDNELPVQMYHGKTQEIIRR